MRLAPVSPDGALAARLERTACLVVAAGTLGTAPIWGLRVAGGVLGGGLMAALSYVALKRGVYALGPRPLEAGVPRGRAAARVALVLLGRHALLLLAGYVIIVRLRLHPLGVLAGASAVTIAAMVEAVRASR